MVPKRHSITEYPTGNGEGSSSVPVPGVFIRSETLPLDHLSESGPASTLTSSEDDLDEISIYLREDLRPLPLRTITPVSKDVGELIKIFPQTISCMLSTMFNGRQATVELEAGYINGMTPFPDFEWHNEASYEKIKKVCDTVIARVKAGSDSRFQSMEHDKIYLRHGSCCVTGTTDETKYNPDLSTFSEESLAQVAIRAICRFIADFPCQKFDLMLYFDYGSIQDRLVGHAGFCEAMKREYARKFEITERNIMGQEYISNADLNELTTEEISNGIVDDCSKLSQTEKEELKKEIARRIAQTLLAVCTYADIPLVYFKHFLLHPKHEYSDNKLPQPQKPSHCGNENCEVLYHKRLIDHMYKFFVQKIIDDRWFHERSSLEVVPISYVRRENKISGLGAGAFSYVSEVSINPAHRGGKSLASVFGKDIRNDEKHKDAFRKEIRMLLYLAVYPHPHILNHITSWEQKETFHILYDKANCNLRDYWKATPGGDLSKARILWFLQQLHGLADAIRKVHQLREPPSLKIAPVLRLKPKNSKDKFSKATSLDYSHEAANGKKPEYGATSKKHEATKGKMSNNKKKKKKTGIVGFHHDIKPENILVFGKRNQLPTLKVSDFGAGKFSIVRGKESGRAASRARGTETYFGPEFDKAMGRKMTRPFDMWALGCVFLEYLLWFFGMQETVIGTGKTFASFRTDLSDHGTGVVIDYFWQKKRVKDRDFPTKLEVPTPEYVVNPKVVEVINVLQTEVCRELPAFLNVVEIIRNLLKTEPTERLNAVDLSNKLDAILAQAEVDLDRPQVGPVSYMARFEEYKRRSASKQKDWIQTPSFSRPAPTPKIKPFPPQFAVAQNPSADVSSIGSSRRRSLPDFRTWSGTDDEKASVLQDFAPPAQGLSHFGTHLAENTFPPPRADLQLQSSDEELFGGPSQQSTPSRSTKTKRTSHNEPWSQFQNSKAQASQPKTPSPARKTPSYMLPTESSSARGERRSIHGSKGSARGATKHPG